MTDELDTRLKGFKTVSPKKFPSDLRLYVKCLSGKLSERRGRGANFARLPRDGSKGELWFRNKLFWLRTIPLESEAAFIALHAETGGYYEGKQGRFSADLLGILRTPKTTQFAVVELKAGKGGDPLFYAVAEGLRNLYFLWQERDRFSSLWKKWNRECVENSSTRKSIWGEGSPFGKLDGKNIRLLIIGDHPWIEAQGNYPNKTPTRLRVGEFTVAISVYSLRKGGTPQSKPHALLPLEKYR